MKVNIYYGGRGMVDDPTIFVMGKIQEVLEELNVNVTRYNLYEMKNTITTLSQTVTEADAVVLATTVEWLGMGGYMQSFLDSCWNVIISFQWLFRTAVLNSWRIFSFGTKAVPFSSLYPR